MWWTGPCKQAGKHMADKVPSSANRNSRANRWLLSRDTSQAMSPAVAMQAARLSVVAEREQSERALQKQSRLTAASEANDRATADRDQFMRELAARLSLQELPAQGTISPNTVTAWVACPFMLDAACGRASGTSIINMLHVQLCCLPMVSCALGFVLLLTCLQPLGNLQNHISDM